MRATQIDYAAKKTMSLHAGNALVQPARLLVPVQQGDCSLVAAKILDLAWPEGGDATLVSFTAEGAGVTDAVAEVFLRRAVEVEHLDADEPGGAVAAQVQLGVDVIGIGAWKWRGDGRSAENASRDFKIIDECVFGIDRRVRPLTHSGDHDGVACLCFRQCPLNCLLTIEDDARFSQVGEAASQLHA